MSETDGFVSSRMPVSFAPILGSAPITEILSNKEITIDGCKGVAEYTECFISLNTSNGVITVNGRDLHIRYLSTSSVVIAGTVSSVEFCGADSGEARL